MPDGRNEFGIELFISAITRYNKGTSDLCTALREASAGYARLHQEIVQENDGEVPKGKAMKRALDAKLAGHATDGTAIGWLGDRQMRAGLLWMNDNPEQRDWVLKHSTATNPRDLLKAWKNHFRKTVREGWLETPSAPEEDLLGLLPGCSDFEIRDEYARLDDLEAKREAREDEVSTFDIRGMDTARLVEQLSNRQDLPEIIQIILAASAAPRPD